MPDMWVIVEWLGKDNAYTDGEIYDSRDEATAIVELMLAEKVDGVRYTVHRLEEADHA